MAGFMLAAGVVGCDGRSASGRVPPRFEQVNGYEVVTNTTPQWTEDDAWRFEEEFRVGGMGGDPEAFITETSALAFGPEGLVTVVDKQDAKIRLFHADGRFLRAFGRQGQGPGELSTPYTLGWDGLDRLWVANGFNGRYTVFDESGEILKVVPRPIHGMNSLIASLVFSSDGSFFWDERSGSGGLPTFLAFDTTGALVDSAAPPPADPPFPEDALRIPMMRGTAFRTLVDLRFLGRHKWAIARDGRKWSMNTGKSRILQTSREGDTLRVVHAEHRPPYLVANDERLIAQAAREQDARPEWFLRPLVQSLTLLPDGHLMVAVVDDPALGSRALDVYTPQGVFLGTVELPFRLDELANIAVSPDGSRLLMLTRGEHDVPFAVVGRLVRP